ncbi:hypothetical protein APHAL10511_002380 [Amanita phalloides]|nr:hypothetical protein APHAL10511_002380 [Amanita phalloides]
MTSSQLPDCVALPLMKGCLKQPSPAPSPGPECGHARKCVAFEADGSEQIFFADEWDRTPTEPTRKLSYQDLMELKEIQRSLPLANQPPDPILGRPGRHYLSAVPIALLPLLPQTDTVASSPQTTHRTTPHRHITSRSPSPLPAPSANSLKISNPLARRRANFAFLPLLDPPSSSDSTPLPSNLSSRSTSPDLPSDTDQSLDPPTPALSYASLDSSPLSRASSLSPEPTFLQLSPRHLSGDERYCNKHFGPRDSYFPDMDEAPDHSVDHRHCAESKILASPRQSTRAHNAAQEVKPPEPPKRARKRNVIVVNDVEIELDDEDNTQPTPDPTLAVPPPSDVADNMGSQLHNLSLNGAEHPNCAKNLKPPETEISTETKSASFDNCTQAIGGESHGGFGLHTPLRFKRRNSSIDNSNFTYTGRS